MLLAMYFDGKSILHRKFKRLGPRAIKQEQTSLYKNICDASAMCFCPAVLFDHTCMMTAQYVVRALAVIFFLSYSPSFL